MPLTPTHLGPSLFLFSLKPKLFNLWALLLGSVVMDLENVFLVLLINPQSCPACSHHGFFHSILGAILGSCLLAFALSFALSETKHKLFLSSLIGWFIHIIFDSLVHPDVFLFWPIKTNPFLISWSLYWPLSLIFTIVGIIGYFHHKKRPINFLLRS